jgi:hypothetical protein
MRELANVCLVAEIVAEGKGEAGGEGVRVDSWIGVPGEEAVADCAGST